MGYEPHTSIFKVLSKSKFVEWIQTFNLETVIGMEVDKLTAATFEPMYYITSYVGSCDMRNSYICLKVRYKGYRGNGPTGRNGCRECPFRLQSGDTCSSNNFPEPIRMPKVHSYFSDYLRNPSNQTTKLIVDAITRRRNWIVRRAGKEGIVV